MCMNCDYKMLLESSGLGFNRNRKAVLEAVGESDRPVSAQEVTAALNDYMAINRVTVYRILELLVVHRLVEKISSGDRSFRYGLGPLTRHSAHPHFFCKSCGKMECLDPEGAGIDMQKLKAGLPCQVDSVQVRLDGTCERCLRRRLAESDNEASGADTLSGRVCF